MSDLHRLFPASYPADMAIPASQPRILIDGRILHAEELPEGQWQRRPVTSPLWLRPAVDAAPVATVLGDGLAVGREVALSALSAATRAWQGGIGPWPTQRVEERIAAVERFTAAMVERRDAVCRLLMWEVAKTWPDAQAEFDRTIQYIRDTIDALKELDRAGAALQFKGGLIAQIRRAPLGVTLCMGPFNYPLNETFTTLIPALIMGNPVVVKLPRHGVLLWDPLLPAFAESFPPGVVNIINGDGKEIIPPLMQTGQVDVLAFIGSSRAAHAIKAAHPRLHRLRGVLGLDAKNPALVLEDADLDLAVAECVKGALSFNGQRCTALKIIFVQRSIAERFVTKLGEAVDGLKNAFPWVEGARLTPLTEPGKPARMAAYIEEALRGGAMLANKAGGQSYCTAYHPAVLYDVRPGMRIYQEEQFGPIVPVLPIDDVVEFIEYVVRANYGQQASLFGQDARTIGRLIDVLVNQVSRINLNSQCQRGPDVFPFTGRKDSAEGTLSISDALRSFSIRSLVASPQTAAGKGLLRAVLDGDHSNFLTTDVIL